MKTKINKKIKFLTSAFSIASIVSLPIVTLSQSLWVPETKKDVSYTNFHTPNIVSEKYIITPKKDLVIIYNLDGDVLYELDTEFLSSGQKNGKISKLFLDGDNLYIISSFIDGLGYAFSSYLTIFNLNEGKTKFSKSLAIGNNPVDNIFELSNNELILTYSLSKTIDIFKNKNHIIINKNDFSLSQRVFPDNRLFEKGIVLDIFKVEDNNADKLMVLSTNKVNDVNFSKFSFNGQLDNPEYPLDLQNDLQDIGLSSVIVKNNITTLTNLNYGYKKEFFKKDDNNYVILDFNNNYKKEDEEFKRVKTSRKFVIINITKNLLNYSGSRPMPWTASLGSTQEEWDNSLSGLAAQGEIAQTNGTPQKSVTWPATLDNVLSSGEIFANVSYTTINNDIYATIDSYEKTLQTEINKKIFKISFNPQTHLNASALNYPPSVDEFNAGTIHKIPNKDVILKINNNYENVFAFKINNQNLENPINISKKTNPSITFKPIPEDISQVFVENYDENKIDSLYTLNNGAQLVNKEIIKHQDKGTFLLKLTISKTPWYSNTAENFVITKLYKGFNALKNYEINFEDNSSNKLVNFKLQNQNIAFKQQLASQVTKKQILDNEIITFSPKLKELITEDNIVLNPNDENQTLEISLNLDNLNPIIKEYLKNNLNYQYTNFENIAKQTFYWKPEAISTLEKKYKNPNLVSNQEIKELFEFKGYEFNDLIEKTADEKTLLVKITLNHLNSDESTIFEYQLNFDEKKENENQPINPGSTENPSNPQTPIEDNSNNNSNVDEEENNSNIEEKEKEIRYSKSNKFKKFEWIWITISALFGIFGLIVFISLISIFRKRK